MPPNEHIDTDAVANEHSFRQIAESIGAVFRLTDASDGQLIFISPGYETIWGRNSANLFSSTRAWFEAIYGEDRERIMDAALSVPQNGGYDEEFRIVRPNGSIRWVRERACPVLDQAREIYRIAAIVEDVTERKVLEKEVIEINDRERANLGQDLHDGICQQLVSIAFATDLLRKDLVAKSPSEAVRAAKITALLDNAISEARNLSHALCPVKLSGDGLTIALKSLAANVSRSANISCGADCSEAVFIQDQAVATHLYRIAQEAVENAITFTNPTRIVIKLAQENDRVSLTISDNGIGHGDGARHFGIGLNIIKLRTTLAGGKLQLDENPTEGTIIICSFQQTAKPAVATSDTDFVIADDQPAKLGVA